MTNEIQDWILSFNSGMAWFNKLAANSTKDTYLPRFKKYCDWAKRDPDQLIDLKVEGLKAINTPKEFGAENLLETFLTTSKDKPSIKLAIRTAVLSFYKANRRPLIEIVDITTPESKKRCPKLSDIEDLDNAFPFLRDKAIVWFVASAPFRVETLTKLRWDDLKPTGDEDVPFYIMIEAERLKGSGRGKYKGMRQVAFLHSLAARKLEAYKKELQEKGYAFKEDSPVFVPYRQKRRLRRMTTANIEKNFIKSSFRAWHDLEGKSFSPHDFRSFVQTAMENAGVNPNMIAVMLGHKPKGIDFHYSEHDVQDLMQKFKAALPYLLPQEVEVEKIKEQSEADRAEISKLRSDYKAQKEQISSMYEFVHKNLDPVRDAFEMITNDPEGYAVWRKIQAKKLEEEREKANVEDAQGNP